MLNKELRKCKSGREYCNYKIAMCYVALFRFNEAFKLLSSIKLHHRIEVYLFYLQVREAEFLSKIANAFPDWYNKFTARRSEKYVAPNEMENMLHRDYVDGLTAEIEMQKKAIEIFDTLIARYHK